VNPAQQLLEKNMLPIGFPFVMRRERISIEAANRAVEAMTAQADDILQIIPEETNRIMIAKVGYRTAELECMRGERVMLCLVIPLDYHAPASAG
jgi:hypothetical protein